MAALFRVGLIAFKIMDRGPNELARPLAGTCGVNGVSDHQQRLKGNHHFVVFNKVANEHQDLLCGHTFTLQPATRRRVVR